MTFIVRTVALTVGLTAMLGACAPNHWQAYNAAPSDDDKPSFYLRGNTALDETSVEAARAEAQRFGNYVCKPDLSKVERLDTRPGGNGWGDYLLWTAKVHCLGA